MPIPPSEDLPFTFPILTPFLKNSLRNWHPKTTKNNKRKSNGWRGSDFKSVIHIASMTNPTHLPFNQNGGDAAHDQIAKIVSKYVQEYKLCAISQHSLFYSACMYTSAFGCNDGLAPARWQGTVVSVTGSCVWSKDTHRRRGHGFIAGTT